MENFWEINVGHLIDSGALLIAYLGYKMERRSDIQEAQVKRDKEREETIRMHTSNQAKLDDLAKFHETQADINRMRDEQVSLLREQTASFKHIAEGFDRRLQLIENRSYGRTV